MTLIFRLIYNDNHIIDLADSYEGIINSQLIYELFMCWKITQEEINNIHLIIDNEQLLNNNYIVNKDNNKIIYIFTSDINIKNKFEFIFTEYNQKYNTEPKPDNTHIEGINNETLKLFEDTDFKKLLNIYIKKPELYSILYNYIQNADIVQSNNNINLDEEQLQYYNTLAEKINFLGFSKTDVINKLIKYNGHLNLTVRSLLQNKK